MTLTVESVDLFDGGFVRTIIKGEPDAAGRLTSLTVWDTVRLAQSGEIMDPLPYEVGDKVNISISKI